MGYVKQNFKDGEVLTAAHLNHIEDGLAEIESKVGQGGSGSGTNGVDGKDGFSPIATVTETSDGATITITDKNGTTSATVNHGADGDDGVTPEFTIGTVTTLSAGSNATATITGTKENPVLNLGIPKGADGASGGEGGGGTGADGEDGGYYTPSVSDSGDLSWTPSKTEMPSVGTVNIKGDDGNEVVTTTGSGSVYTATVKSVKALTAGATFIMIPHTASTEVSPKINVNGLGEKNIRQPLTINTSATTTGATANWLAVNKPVKLMYDGTFWKTVEIPRPSASGMYGTVPVESGGTGGTTQETACTNLGAVGYIAQTLTEDQKQQARANIGALGVSQVRVGEITLNSASWVENSTNLYSQVVSIEGVTEYSQVDLTPSVEQLVVFYEKDLAFVTENEDGVVTVYAIGQKPTNNYTMQVTITEVKV